jgi:chromosome segregation ATPase
VQIKLRQAEEKLTSMQEQLEEEEETRKNLETKISNLTVQVLEIPTVDI